VHDAASLIGVYKRLTGRRIRGKAMQLDRRTKVRHGLAELGERSSISVQEVDWLAIGPEAELSQPTSTWPEWCQSIR
jgi:hypothetical protein